MKSINTLVRDVQSILTGLMPPSKEAVESFGKQLAAKLTERLCEGSQEPRLRPSNFYYGDRKLWYAMNKPELADPLEPETRQKFLYGDVIEAEILFLAETAGHEVLRDIEVEYSGITGHIDAIIDGVLVDIKSASGRGFSKFANHELEHNDPFGYLDQLSIYLTALRDDPRLKVKTQGAFVVVDKENGRMCLDIYNIKKRDYDQEIVRKTEMLSGDELPDRCHRPIAYGVSGNARLGTECSYCPWKQTCWADANDGKGIRTFAYSSGPVHLVRVQKQPEVKEII